MHRNKIYLLTFIAVVTSGASIVHSIYKMNVILFLNFVYFALVGSLLGPEAVQG